MPRALDFTGRRFGQLTVLERAGKVKFGVMVTGWRCQCDCGAIEIVPQVRLPYRDSIPKDHRVTACAACRQPPCIVCQTRVPLARGKKNTCCDVCEQTKQRANQRDHWHRKMAADPDHAMKKYRRVRQRMQDDPDYAAKMRAQWRAAHARYKEAQTDAEREAERAWHRQWYYDNRDYILEQRRARLAAMSVEELAAYQEDMRRRGREWRRQWRRWLDEHPDEKAAYRERYREWVRAREIRELMTSLDRLEGYQDE